MELLTWIATGIGILGIGFLAFKKPFAREGCWCWCISNPILIFTSYYYQIYAQCLLFSVFTILAAIGAWNWRKK